MASPRCPGAQREEGRSPGPLTLVSLRSRHLRPRGGRRRGLLLLPQGIEHAALPWRSAGGLLGLAAGVLDDGFGLAVPAGKKRQDNAGGKERRAQDRGGAGGHVGGAAAR